MFLIYLKKVVYIQNSKINYATKNEKNMGIWEKMVTVINTKTPVVTPGPKDKLSTSKPVGLAKITQFFKYQSNKISRSIIDEIDKVLAEHGGFTEKELDFIINYDIKYKMGKELNK